MSIENNKFYAVCEKFANLLILNILWLICCLPILTIGPATSAMLSVIRQWKLYQDTSSLRNFVYYFRENFKYSFIIGLFWLLYGTLLFFNLFYLNQDQTVLKIMMTIPLLAVTILILFASTYILPLISHYKVSLAKAVKHAFLLSIIYFPTTFLILAVFLLLIVIVKYVPIMSLVIFSIGALFQYSLCQKVFDKIGDSHSMNESM
ncbi:DUF624 domain-containing protein [Niallia sp.]|uniref:YesL family protein n=1 Tax=Niallia sp. TaxID=2837523 RepID=UPI00289698D1|nr:DUF624 domain-containing protein [Niallia sp.]